MALLASPTAQDLISSVRVLLNQPNPLNSFWSDEELIRYLNEAVRIYFAEMSMINEGQFSKQVDLDIVTDTDTVALPSDFFSIKNVFKKVTNGYIMLPYRNNVTEGYSTQGGTSGNNYLPYYSFRVNSLLLRPVPNFSETGGLRVEYIAFPDMLVYGGDALTSGISPVFRQVIEMYAVYKAKLRESMTNGVAMHKVAEDSLNQIYTQFKAAITPRSHNPTFVVPFSPETDGW